MAEIELRNRKREVIAVALVDDEDYARLALHRWCRIAAGYAYRHNGIYMHREVLSLVPGDGKSVDHLNRDKLDNRRANLRLVSHAENGQNVPAQQGTSRYRGVYFDVCANRWRAVVMLNGKANYVGVFKDEHEAGQRAAAWRLEHMPAAID